MRLSRLKLDSEVGADGARQARRAPMRGAVQHVWLQCWRGWPVAVAAFAAAVRAAALGLAAATTRPMCSVRARRV